MRKNYLLLVVLVSLLFTGCLGGGTSYVYDGSPTALEVVIKRDGAQALSTEADQYVQVRLWMENSYGDIIYQTHESVPLSEVTAEGYTMARQVPADKGYSVLAVYSDNQGYFEVAQKKQINAPAEVLTTASVDLVPVGYEIVVPDVVYNGGSTTQFKIIFPEEYEHLFFWVLRLRDLPWDSDFHFEDPIFLPAFPQPIGNTDVPRQLWYQFYIYWDYNYVGPPSPKVTFLPSLARGEELAFVMQYPYPGWAE